VTCATAEPAIVDPGPPPLGCWLILAAAALAMYLGTR